jgi:hypothetical protein
MKEKTELGRSVNIRLTQSEFAEYVRGGVVDGMFLQVDADVPANERRHTERD